MICRRLFRPSIAAVPRLPTASTTLAIPPVIPSTSPLTSADAISRPSEAPLRRHLTNPSDEVHEGATDADDNKGHARADRGEERDHRADPDGHKRERLAEVTSDLGKLQRRALTTAEGSKDLFHRGKGLTKAGREPVPEGEGRSGAASPSQ